MKLNYKKIGNGRPLIIIHGLFGSLDNWGALGKRFSEKYTVYLADLRNHGRSPHHPEMNYDVMAMDVNELIQNEKIERPILLGHSMGGKTALNFVNNHPGVIDQLIIADIGTKAYKMHHDQITKGLLNINLNKVKSRNEALQFLSEYVKEIGIQQFLLKNLYWIEKGKLSWRMNLPVIIDNMHEIIKEIKITKNKTNTLFLRGGRSNYILEEDLNDLHVKFPNSKINTINNVGHWLHAENPNEFYNQIVNFIK